MIESMSLIALGPLGDTQPSVGSALVMIGVGVFGFLFLFLKRAEIKRQKVDWRKLLLFCAVFLLFTVGGSVMLVQQLAIKSK